jgi:hypothetical protein
MKMSQIISQNITLGVVCSALKPTHAGELHFDSDSARNRVIQDIGKTTKKNAKSRYTDMMNQIPKGDSVIVLFFEKSFGWNSRQIVPQQELGHNNVVERRNRKIKVVLYALHCKAKKSVFVLLAPFVDGDYDFMLLIMTSFLVICTLLFWA